MSIKIKLKNYTSTVSPQRSVSLIEEALLKIGATHIAKSYDNGELLIFKVEARHHAIAELLLSGIKKMHKDTRARLEEQARRNPIEVFLPYVYDMQNDQTLFQKLEASKFKMLKAAN